MEPNLMKSLSSPISKYQFAFANGRDEKKDAIKIDRVLELYHQLLPLTNAYFDSRENCISLYKTEKYGLLGVVLDNENRMTTIPGKNIKNPLNPLEPPEKLVNRLECSLCKVWDIAYDIKQFTLTLWPHLEGAVRGKGETRDIRIHSSPLRYTTQEDLVKMINLKTKRRN